MIINHIKELAELQSEKVMRDVVVTVPPYADFKYRLALKDAITLAGLSSQAFIHENTAAALYHGINRLDNETTHYVLIYNLGSSSLKVSLVEYSAIENEGKEKRTYK